jgi:hypothetical protein
MDVLNDVGFCVYLEHNSPNIYGRNNCLRREAECNELCHFAVSTQLNKGLSQNLQEIAERKHQNYSAVHTDYVLKADLFKFK